MFAARRLSTSFGRLAMVSHFFCRVNCKGGIKMNPEEVAAEGFEMELEDGRTVTVGPIRQREVEVEVVREEEPADFWQANGFLQDIARICSDLEAEHER